MPGLILEYTPRPDQIHHDRRPRLSVTIETIGYNLHTALHCDRALHVQQKRMAEANMSSSRTHPKWQPSGWRIQQKYSNGVLIGNWLEDRLGKVTNSVCI